MKKFVLIVDDSFVNRQILRRILSDEFEVKEAADGSEALKIFSEYRDHVIAIMLDLIMPGMSGYDFLSAFKKYESEHIPVIVSTAESGRDSEIEALKLGAWDFIAKPYVPEIIMFRLKNAILRSQLTAFQELKYKAEFDVLTGIYNKDKFFDATREMLNANPDTDFTLVRFDVDRFHLINSYFGSQFGDRLLQHISHSLIAEMHAFYAVSTYGRITSDIFAACIPTADTGLIEEGIKRFDHNVKSFDASFDIVTIYGIYIIKDRTAPVDEIYDCATLAAKNSKGNYLQYFSYYDDAHDESIRLEQEIINDMNVAINTEQFIVWYQPKHDIRIDSPCGAEALVRWNNPKKGMISPGDFIPVFEHNGFISKLDYYVWEHVCRDIRRWIDEGKKLYPVSVNVSRVDLANPHLVEQIVSLVDKYNIPHELLNLELTESAYTDNPEKMVQVIEKLQKQGFIIMMDDFGSGYSSLSILKDIDVNVLKIDMRFFSKTAVEGKSRSIIASVIRMAKWLCIPVIAEGVEKREQAEFLKELGCEYIQGYYYAKPMPVAEYEQYMKACNADDKIISVKNDGSVKIWDNNFLAADIKQAAAMLEYGGNSLQFVQVNNLFYDLFGYKNQEDLLFDPLEMIPPEYREGLLNACKTATGSPDAICYEYKRSTRDGNVQWVYMLIKYIGSVSDRKILFTAFSDVTALKQLDNELATFINAMESYSYTGRLLVVDDIELNRASLKEIFGHEYKILEAENGAQALEVLEQAEGSVDAILLDLIMPVMDGKTFLSKIKIDERYAGIPVIIITADDSVERQNQIIALGARDYVTKPFVDKVVLRRVKNAIGIRGKLAE